MKKYIYLLAGHYILKNKLKLITLKNKNRLLAKKELLKLYNKEIYFRTIIIKNKELREYEKL